MCSHQSFISNSILFSHLCSPPLSRSPSFHNLFVPSPTIHHCVSTPHFSSVSLSLSLLPSSFIFPSYGFLHPSFVSFLLFPSHRLLSPCSLSPSPFIYTHRLLPSLLVFSPTHPPLPSPFSHPVHLSLFSLLFPLPSILPLYLFFPLSFPPIHASHFSFFSSFHHSLCCFSFPIPSFLIIFPLPFQPFLLFSPFPSFHSSVYFFLSTIPSSLGPPAPPILPSLLPLPPPFLTDLSLLAACTIQVRVAVLPR